MSPLAQIWTIARMEMKRAFFSRRGLWVYALALFPAVVFAIHSLEVKVSLQSWSGERIVDAAVLAALQPGMKDSEVFDSNTRFRRRNEAGDLIRVERRNLTYFDGKLRYDLSFDDGELKRIRPRPIVDFDEDRSIFAAMFQYFYLRLAIFFGCLGIFVNLFRGELLDKSLHFWFLAPVKREILLLGKYIAGLIASVAIFTVSTAFTFAAMLAPQYPAERAAYWASNGPEHLFWYLVAAAAGCIGYGSVFLAAGLLMKNPILLAAVIEIWESVNGFLPVWLQKMSVLHYLHSLCPVPPPLDPDVPALLRVLLAPAAPSSALTALLGLTAVTAIVLWLASRAVRRLEINYSTE
jgi:hypothetical protein